MGSNFLAEHNALREGDILFRAIADAMPQIIWSTLPDGNHDYYNRGWYEFTGVPEGSTDGEGWNGMFHPDDQERAWARWRHSLDTGEPYEIEYRLRHHSGEYRWTLGRANPLRDADGTIFRWIGTCTDIHEARIQAERNEILSRELSHRIKNIFAVIGGLIAMGVRLHPESRTFANDLRNRIDALGRAHECARPHSEKSQVEGRASSLHSLLADILQPYGGPGGRALTIDGEDTAIDDRGATPLALIFHELATNSAKYGALGAEDGSVGLHSERRDGMISIRWTERNGPPVIEPPGRIGFGTKLVEISVQQLGGDIERRWKPDGLEVTLSVLPERLRR